MKQIFILITMLTCVIAYTQENKAGTLDSSFGDNGKVLTSFPNSYSECTAAALTKEGNIIAAGRISPIDDSFENGFMTVKYSADGILDTSFGNKGLAIAAGPYEGYAVAVQPDNKIIIAGVGYGQDTKYIAIARFNADGNVDSGFGENGRIINLIGTIAFDIALQQDGKIVFSGTNGYAFVTLRYMENGIIDEAFGNNGVVITDYNSIAYASANLIQPDGKIVVAGDNGVKILLARYSIDGTLDQGFGINGKVIFKTTSSINKAYNILLQPDGKLVISGSAGNLLYSDVQLLRFLPNGSLDSSFGSNGIVIKKMQNNSQAYNAALQKDDKILVCGYMLDNFDNNHFLTERFSINGIIDSSFGNNGYEITEMDQSDAAHSLIIQNSNKIVLIGNAREFEPNPVLYRIALARYNNNDLSKKQIIITKIKRWLQHHNGFTWDNNSINNYVVQRSYDGIHWKAVSGEQPAMSNSSVHYYEDASPLIGANYYRLQTTSVDGAVNYSNVLAATTNENAIKVSPNPAKNVLHIEGLSSSNKTKITVVDFAGNIKLQTVANSTSYNLNIASLKAGNYLLRIETGDEVVTKKFVKE